ncbi:MAG TPA: zinc-dependent alcohol dehydrogenase family protein [Bryobacteraceae bacterium]|jgi:propanol-preferring alcohol dehydrogenase|nr:zinc-dependent alcohol dehydrogenase family protein [Bryobacteraceae bacterium]
MKACVVSSRGPIETNPLRSIDVPKPEPGSHEVLIKVHACGVCRTDLHVIEGELPVLKSPLIPGHQIVGVVERCGARARRFAPGARVGVPWLHSTDGTCKFCRAGKENLCPAATFTGHTVDGGYAEYAVAPEAFVYRIPDGFPDLHAAPLLCAGIIGFRCLRVSGIEPGGTLGLYGFGAAAHVAIQVARYWGVRVLAFTRDVRHQKLALELGAVWAGGGEEESPEKLDAAILFAPAGELVPAALRNLDRGGVVVAGGIHMSPIPQMPYDLLYWERVVRSVANNTRKDGEDFLELAAKIPVHTQTETFPLDQANAALNALKHDAIRGAAVLTISNEL